MNRRPLILILQLLGLLTAIAAKADALTYWTADGSVKPLPAADGRTLKVPAEALAVDLRGVHDTADGTSWLLDTTDASANCLYYLNGDDVVGGLPCSNVVIDGVCDGLLLTDEDPFYCPVAFTAVDALFSMTPRRDIPDSPAYSWPYVDTLVLPFDVDMVVPQTVNGTMPPDWMSAAVYEGCTTRDGKPLLVFGAHDAKRLKANEPYLVTFNFGLYGSHVLFMGENRRVEVTSQAVATGDVYSFVGSTVSIAVEPTDYLFSREGEGCFVMALDNMLSEPFRCVLKAADGLAPTEGGGDIGSSAGEEGTAVVPTGEDMVELNYVIVGDGAQSVAAPSVSRTLVASSLRTPYTLDGRRLTQPRRGVNIVGGRKVYIK